MHDRWLFYRKTHRSATKRAILFHNTWELTKERAVSVLSTRKLIPGSAEVDGGWPPNNTCQTDRA
jgi:hypothetical protein